MERSLLVNKLQSKRTVWRMVGRLVYNMYRYLSVKNTNPENMLLMDMLNIVNECEKASTINKYREYRVENYTQ